MRGEGRGRGAAAVVRTYPPPWNALTVHATSTALPAAQTTVWVFSGGSFARPRRRQHFAIGMAAEVPPHEVAPWATRTCEPRSASFAFGVLT